MQTQEKKSLQKRAKKRAIDGTMHISAKPSKADQTHSSPSVPILLCLLLFLLLFLSRSLSLSSTHLLCTCCQHVIFPKSQRLMPDTRAAGICTLTELCKWRYEQPVMPHCKNFLLPSNIWDTVLYLWAGCLVLFAWVHFC